MNLKQRPKIHGRNVEIKLFIYDKYLKKSIIYNFEKYIITCRKLHFVFVYYEFFTLFSKKNYWKNHIF